MHSYSNSEKNVEYEKYVNKWLKEYGCENTESILNEWNPGIKRRGTLADSAYISEMMLKMQDTTCDMLMYYNGDVNGSYNGLYNPIIKEPFKAYYVLKAFNELYKLKNQVKVTGVPKNVSCVCAADNGKCAIVLTNMGNKKRIKINCDIKQEFKIYRLNKKYNLELTSETDLNEEIEIGKYETVLIKGE